MKMGTDNPTVGFPYLFEFHIEEYNNNTSHIWKWSFRLQGTSNKIKSNI